MNLSEIIRRVGDENVELQNLQESMVSAQGSTITFRTSQANAQKMMAAAMGQKSDRIGLVVWLPRDKAEQAIRE